MVNTTIILIGFFLVKRDISVVGTLWHNNIETRRPTL